MSAECCPGSRQSRRRDFFRSSGVCWVQRGQLEERIFSDTSRRDHHHHETFVVLNFPLSTAEDFSSGVFFGQDFFLDKIPPQLPTIFHNFASEEHHDSWSGVLLMSCSERSRIFVAEVQRAWPCSTPKPKGVRQADVVFVGEEW